jgi:hypothetical protein
MKQFSILFLLLSCLILSCADSPNSKIIGEWTGTTDKGKTGSFIFYKDGSFKLIVGTFVFPVKGFDSQWKIDTSHNPLHLDLIITNLDTGLKKTLEALIESLTEDKMTLHLKGDVWQLGKI